MNCLEFRRLYLSDPYHCSEEMEAHRLACDHCHRFARQQSEQEIQLKRAVKVAVPEGLASRIIVSKALHGRANKATVKRRPFKLLASLLAASFTLLAVLWRILFIPTEQLVLTHVTDEIHHLQDNFALTTHAVNQKIRSSGLYASQSLGPVRYAGSCQIRDHVGAHIIIPGKRGPVTVLLMPKESIQHPLTVKDHRFSGRIVPFTGGSMAVIGERGEPIDHWIDYMSQRLAQAG